ncbi:MAG: hypothetical protein QXH91_06890 [Candidatus Bathyarchaeia archaeon]
MTNVKKLLLLLIDDNCLEKVPIMATLAWLARKNGLTFDSYISSDVIEFLGMKIDGTFFSDMHAEQLYYVCNAYDVYYCAYGTTRRFLRDLKVFDKKCVSIKEYGLLDFYLDIFTYFGLELPKKAVMVKCGPVSTGKASGLHLDSYCYPEIYYSKAIGIGSNATDNDLERLKEIGVTHISTLYCEDELVEKLRKIGFNVKVIDSLSAEDTYGSVTTRIADRWLRYIKGFAVGDYRLTAFWVPFFCRNDLISLYDEDWKRLATVVGSYSSKKKSKVVWGLQSSDDFITELSKFDKIMQIVMYMKPVITAKVEIRYPAEWLKPSVTYWDRSYSNAELSKKADIGGIAACILFFAENLCHFSAIPRLFELAKLSRTKIGVASNISWYEYAANWMEDTLIPVESGGCFPLVEPLLCSAGLGAATEAKGYISSETLASCLQEARKKAAKLWGEHLVPIGYYPWQDANPYYRPDTGEPQFNVVKDAGFGYYITCKNMDQPPQIVYQDGDFVAVNQQNSMIDLVTLTRILNPKISSQMSQGMIDSIDKSVRVPWSYDPLSDLKRWERFLSMKNKPGWIIISLDAPFWGFSPFYFDRAYILKSAMEYIASGGETGKLFTSSPYEVSCYAKILKSKGLL